MAAKEVDYSNMKLGKPPVKHDPRTLHFHNYLDFKKLPKTPPAVRWGKKIADDKWGVMHNNFLEDCSIAGAGHLIMAWTSDNGKIIRPGDREIITAFCGVAGYEPYTGRNNVAVYLLDALNYWRKKGVARHKIMAYLKVNHKNHEHIRQACYLFGGCYVGLQLPKLATKQTQWKLTSAGLKGKGKPGSLGGHCVAIIGYDKHGLIAITWGIVKKISWAFWDAYCEEAYAVIGHDFITKNGSPSGLKLDMLQKDLKAVK